MTAFRPGACAFAGDVHPTHRAQQRRQFSPEFKADAVALVRSSGRPIAAIAHELGVGESNLSYGLKKDAEVFQDSGVGDGPVDAVLNAIDAITGLKGRLEDYQLRSVTSGKDALGEVSVRVDFDGTVVPGKGSSTDVIEASARAYVNALNRLVQPAAGHKAKEKEIGP